MTQADVAKALGKLQSFVAKYENGERRIDVVEFVDIAAALGVVSGDILAQVESAGHLAKRTAHRSRKALPLERSFLFRLRSRHGSQGDHGDGPASETPGSANNARGASTVPQRPAS
jgi:transcriptional regulator with XRE-family HTH domain